MPGNFKDEDIRILKTNEALMNAMSKLLEHRNFNRITVNNLCEEAQIGRSTFYSHYQDKYDLMKHWLINYRSLFMFKSDAYEDYEKIINDQVNNNIKIIRNFLENANSETYELVCDHIFSLLGINFDGEISQENIILSKFCSGGIMNYLMWFVQNQSKTNFSLMNPYCYNILFSLHNLNKEHN